MSSIQRLYVRKKENFREEEARLFDALSECLGEKLTAVALYHRYDVEGLSGEEYEKAEVTVFSEPPVDAVYRDCPTGDMVIASEFLPGSTIRKRIRPSNAFRY